MDLDREGASPARVEASPPVSRRVVRDVLPIPSRVDRLGFEPFALFFTPPSRPFRAAGDGSRRDIGFDTGKSGP